MIIFRVSLNFSTKNGGYIKIKNFDNGDAPTIDGPHYYVGNTASMTHVVVFDFRRPVHCKETSVWPWPWPWPWLCPDNWLHVGESFTKNVSVLHVWGVLTKQGWDRYKLSLITSL